MTDTTTTTTFSWSGSSNAATYTIVISTNANLSSPMFTLTGLSGTSVVVEGLLPGATYYWRVTAVNSFGSNQTAVGSFATEQANDFLVTDFETVGLRLHPLADGSPESVLAELPAEATALGYGGAFEQDDGLAGLSLPDGSRVVYYVRGGSYYDGYTHAANDLYRAVISSTGVAGAWQFVTRFGEGGQGGPLNEYSPIIAGLAFFGNSEANSLYGIMRGPYLYDNFEDAASLINIRRNPNSLNEIMNFTIPLDGALASSHQRGSLFLVGEVPDYYYDRPAPRGGQRGFTLYGTGTSVMEFDPRNNYLKNAWSQFDPLGEDTGLFYTDDGTMIVPSDDFDAANIVNGQIDVKGAAWVGSRLHLSVVYGGFSSDRSVTNSPFYIRFNPNPASGGSYIEVISRTTGVHTALGETVQGTPAASIVLSQFEGSFDDYTINESFARLAFSQQTIDSGFLVPLFMRHFLQTAWDMYDCFYDDVGDGVFWSIEDVLAEFTDTVGGIGHATAALRDPIRPTIPFIDRHPCSGDDGEALPTSLDYFIGTDSYNGYLRLQPLAEVPWLFGDDDIISGGLPGLYGGFFEEDGLASTSFVGEDTLRGSSDLFIQMDTFYVLGGYEDGYGSGNYYTYNQLYVSSFYDYGNASADRGGSGWFLIEKYVNEQVGDYEYGAPVLGGLAFQNYRADGKHPHSIGLYGVLIDDFRRFPTIGTPQRGDFFDPYAGNSQIVDVQTDFNINSFNNLVSLMDFRVPLEGALASSTERGTFFVVANIAEPFLFDPLPLPRGDAAPYFRAIIEFDPRANYIRNAWGGSDFNYSDGTTIDEDMTGFELTFLYDFTSPIRGAAFAGGQLVLATLPSVNAVGRPVGGLVPQLVYFDPDAAGTNSDPHVTRVERASAAMSALGETIDEAAMVAAMPVLTPDTLTAGQLNLAGVNELFSRVAYSQQALDSGVVKRVFEMHFLETSLNPTTCRESMLFTTTLPVTLAANTQRRNGFGRTAFQLRENLTTDHGCATEANPSPGEEFRASR